MRIVIETNIPERITNLLRLQNRNVPFANKRTQDGAAEHLRTGLIRRWSRDMTARNRSFPRAAWARRSVTRARVQGRNVSPASVANVIGDDILRSQTYGAIRMPRRPPTVDKGGVKVPRSKRNWGRGRLRRSARDYTVQQEDRKLIFRRTGPGPRQSRLIAVMHAGPNIPVRYRIEIPVANTNRIIQRRLGEFAMQQEIAEWESRLR